MKKRVFLTLLATSVLFSTGCMFWKKSKTPRESTAIATDVEKEFQQRWMTKRLADLAAQGITGEAAQQQADQEFHAKFAYAQPVKKR